MCECVYVCTSSGSAWQNARMEFSSSSSSSPSSSCSLLVKPMPAPAFSVHLGPSFHFPRACEPVLCTLLTATAGGILPSHKRALSSRHSSLHEVEHTRDADDSSAVPRWDGSGMQLTRRRRRRLGSVRVCILPCAAPCPRESRICEDIAETETPRASMGARCARIVCPRKNRDAWWVR